jgi:integrase
MAADHSPSPRDRNTPKPRKPYPSFPLNPHRSGKWYIAVSHGGRKTFHYFGRWEDPDGALNEYLAAAAKIHAGPCAPMPPNKITAGEVVDRFLVEQEARAKEGEIQYRQFGDTRHALLNDFLPAIGEATRMSAVGDDQLAGLRDGMRAKYKGNTCNNRFYAIRACLRWASIEAKLIDSPLHLNRALRKIGKRHLRRESREREEAHGKAIFTLHAVRRLLLAARLPMEAMILLGVNCALHQKDLARICWRHIDLERGYLDFARRKREVPRQATLWPETVEALREWQKVRPAPAKAKHADRVFITRWGRPFGSSRVTRLPDNSVDRVTHTETITPEFAKLCEQLGLTRSGRNFRALRRTFATIADEAGDRSARLRIMGHELPGNDPHYVKRMPAKRLKKITDHVRHRLFIAALKRHGRHSAAGTSQPAPAPLPSAPPGIA